MNCLFFTERKVTNYFYSCKRFLRFFVVKKVKKEGKTAKCNI